MSAMSAIDGAIERARASASRLQQAHQHSIRTGEGREIQRQAAEKAQAIVVELLETRGAVVEMIDAATGLADEHDALHGDCACEGAPGCTACRMRAALARWHGRAPGVECGKCGSPAPEQHRPGCGVSAHGGRGMSLRECMDAEDGGA